MASVQRMKAFRYFCPQKVVSQSAVLLVAEITPIDMISQEIKITGENIRRKEKVSIMSQWLGRWSKDSRRRWTPIIVKYFKSRLVELIVKSDTVSYCTDRELLQSISIILEKQINQSICIVEGIGITLVTLFVCAMTSVDR